MVGKQYRKGLSLMEFMNKFPNDRVAEEWLTMNRWNDKVICPNCESSNIQTRAEEKRRNQPYRCRVCRKDFSVKTGTLMQSSHVGYRAWVLAIYSLTNNIKGISSMKLHRDLGVTQKTAWLLAHKIRRAYDTNQGGLFNGPAEVDVTYIGGLEVNKHKKLKAGRGAVGKVAVIGMKDRKTNKVVAMPVERTNAYTLHGFIKSNLSHYATLYTDYATAYKDMPQTHRTVKRVGEYVRGNAHTNGIESFWALLKRGYQGTYHKISPKHLHRYVTEFAGRHNIDPLDTLEQMNSIAVNLVGKQITYKELVGYE